MTPDKWEGESFIHFMMWKLENTNPARQSQVHAQYERINHLDVKWKSFSWPLNRSYKSFSHMLHIYYIWAPVFKNQTELNWGASESLPALDMRHVGYPWLGVTCQIQRQLGCISPQARHKPADKMQGVGHGDKIIIIWNILIPVEDRPG